MSNSEKMTVEERLALKVKSSPLGELFDDDDLAEVCKRAIDTAFFKNRVVPRSYGGADTSEPVLVEEARKIFREKMSAKIAEVAEELAKTPEFMTAMAVAAAAELPALLLSGSRSAATMAAVEQSQQTLNQVQDLMRAKFGH
jgi:hypothetical protein